MVALSAILPGGAAALGPLLVQAIGSDVSPIDALGDLAEALPPPLRALDVTPSVPTGASDVPRTDAFTYAALAAVPRLVEALGPEASGVVVGGEAFALTEVYDDPVSGFDAVQLRSLSDDRAVFAVDGTDFGSLPDIIAALTLGRTQVASPAFAAMVADAGAAALADGREVVFTGASLGGALVQAAGYETAEAIGAAAPSGTADPVTVFGVDPLGGRDAAEDLNGGALDPAVLERLNALNIRTEGDVVSRIGGHIGDTLTLRAVNAAGEPVELSAGEAHINIESLVTNLTSDALFAAGARGDPEEIGGLTLLANALGPEVSELLIDAGQAGLFDQQDGPSSGSLAGGGTLDPAGNSFDLDVNRDGVADLRVLLGASDLLVA